MYRKTGKIKEGGNKAVANSITQKRRDGEQGITLVDNRKDSTCLGDRTGAGGQLQNRNSTKSTCSTSGSIQLNKYGKLEKVSKEAMWHKNFGKQLVGTYRLIGDATDAMQKGKNREAMKAAAIGLTGAGVSIATMLSGIPGLVGLEGDTVSTSLSSESAGQQGASSAVGTGLGAVESVDLPSVASKVQATTTGGAIANKIYAKVGTLKNTIETLKGFIPFFTAVKSIAKGGKLATQSKDDFNRNKGGIARAIMDVISSMDIAIQEVNFEDFGEVTVTTANSINIFNHTERSLNEIYSKYQTKANGLISVLQSWETKHEDVMPLLGQSTSDTEVTCESL